MASFAQKPLEIKANTEAKTTLKNKLKEMKKGRGKGTIPLATFNGNSRMQVIWLLDCLCMTATEALAAGFPVAHISLGHIEFSEEKGEEYKVKWIQAMPALCALLKPLVDRGGFTMGWSAHNMFSTKWFGFLHDRQRSFVNAMQSVVYVFALEHGLPFEKLPHPKWAKPDQVHAATVFGNMYMGPKQFIGFKDGKYCKEMPGAVHVTVEPYFQDVRNFNYAANGLVLMDGFSNQGHHGKCCSTDILYGK